MKAITIIMNYHQLSAMEIFRELKTDMHGLSCEEVLRRQTQYGKNLLSSGKRKSLLRRFFAQFQDFTVLILLAAAAISFFTSLWEGTEGFADSIIILVIVCTNAFIGVIQESRAEKAISALQKLSAPTATVIRENKAQKIAAEELVPGDIILLKVGDYIPADARLIEAVELQATEASLTGESTATEKSADSFCREDAPLAEQSTMVFSSSGIVQGHGKAVVVATGMHTQVGKIASLLTENDAPQTPLQKRLEKTGKLLGIGAILICLSIFLMGIFQKVAPLEMFMISISLAVAAIPEGMPAVVTIVLAFGVRKMAEHRAIIRKLPAVETLGSATVICSDKTGTLTQNRMTVTQIRCRDGILSPESLLGQELSVLGALCCNADAVLQHNTWIGNGEPTENAIAVFAAQHGKQKKQLETATPRVKEFPFQSRRKRMSTVHRLPNGKYRIILKGAPDFIFPFCTKVSTEYEILPLTPSELHRLQVQNEAMTTEALRVLAVAYRDCDFIPRTAEEAEQDLIFCGFFGMIDPPRPDVKQAVLSCKQAGIRPVMITGDHISTAKAIGKKLGIFCEGDKAITGEALELLSQKELTAHIDDYSIFARVSPQHKVRIVQAFQQKGGVVAMTGDGVNDAPALKIADIGCAMGIGGTDVAKGAADMILTDDNFSTIVSAVQKGREIYANIQKAVHFLLSCNIGEILTVFVAFLLRLPTPLLAIQLLWINLVTDSLPALALGVEPGEDDLMRQQPVSRQKSLFSNGLWYHILLEGCFIGSLSLLAFVMGKSWYDVGETPVIGRTMAFAVLSFSQLVHAFNSRSKKSLFHIGFFSNPQMILSFIICFLLQLSVMVLPPLAALFKVASLNLTQWSIVLLLSFSPLAVLEMDKFVTARKEKNIAMHK